MKRVMVFLCVVSLGVLCFNPKARADEVSDLKNEMIKMEERHQKEMAELKARIEALESSRTPVAKSEAPQGIEERVVAIEEKLQRPFAGGLLSLKGEKWEIGGKLELEYVDIEGDTGTDNDKGHFQLDRFVLNPKATLNEHISLFGEIEFQESDVIMKRVYVSFAKLPKDSFVRAGLDYPFIDFERKTETHTINATAFGFRDTDLGIYGGGKIAGPWYWRGSVANGLQLSTAAITEDSSYKILHEDDNAEDNNQNKEVGFGLGVDQTFEKFGTVNILGFGYWGSLSAEDIAVLQGMTGYGAAEEEDKKTKLGINLSYQFKNFAFMSQHIHAVDGTLDREGWFIQPSYKLAVREWKYLNAYEFLFRYNQLNVDIDKAFADTKTWDRQTYTIAVITDIAKDLKLKSEYNINNEKTGSGDVNNNEFVAQLEYKF